MFHRFLKCLGCLFSKQDDFYWTLDSQDAVCIEQSQMREQTNISNGADVPELLDSMAFELRMQRLSLEAMSKHTAVLDKAAHLHGTVVNLNTPPSGIETINPCPSCGNGPLDTHAGYVHCAYCPYVEREE